MSKQQRLLDLPWPRGLLPNPAPVASDAFYVYDRISLQGKLREFTRLQ